MRYKRNVSTSNTLTAIAETEIKSNKLTDRIPIPFAGINNDQYAKICYNLGHQDFGGSTESPQELMSLPVAAITSPGMPIRSYRYIKKITSVFQIYMKARSDTDIDRTMARCGVLSFRVLIVSPKVRNMAQGAVSPAFELWLNEQGNKRGFDSTETMNQLDLQTWVLNRKQFKIEKDMRFKLAPPSVGTTSNFATDTPNVGDIPTSNLVTSFGNVPNSKTFRFDQNVQKKTFFGDVANNAAYPRDTNDNKYVLILASSPLGQTALATNWRLSSNMTTTYYSM
jgi:hypothetical protein